MNVHGFVQLKRDNTALRQLLWWYHDKNHRGLVYGDDGELQCNVCNIDFKRQTITEIGQTLYLKEIGYNHGAEGP